MTLSTEEKQKIQEEEEYRAKAVSMAQATVPSAKNKLVAGLLALFLGTLGIHKFYLGKTGAGLVYLLLSIFLFWTIIVPVILGLIALIEAIILFTLSDEAFHQKYSTR